MHIIFVCVLFNALDYNQQKLRKYTEFTVCVSLITVYL